MDTKHKHKHKHYRAPSYQALSEAREDVELLSRFAETDERLRPLASAAQAAWAREVDKVLRHAAGV